MQKYFVLRSMKAYKYLWHDLKRIKVCLNCDILKTCRRRQCNWHDWNIISLLRKVHLNGEWIDSKLVKWPISNPSNIVIMFCHCNTHYCNYFCSVSTMHKTNRASQNLVLPLYCCVILAYRKILNTWWLSLSVRSIIASILSTKSPLHN